MYITDIGCYLGYTPEIYVTAKPPVTADSLCKRLDKYLIEDCVAFTSNAIANIINGNSEIMETAHKNPRIRPCSIVTPFLEAMGMENTAQLEQYLALSKPEGVTMLPLLQSIKLDTFYCDRLFSVLNNLHMPLLLVLTWPPFYELIPPILQKYPNLKLVLLRSSHSLGGYVNTLLDRFENVFFDTSIMVDESFVENAVKRFGSDRFVFGNCTSLYDPAGALGLVMYSNLTDEEKNSILSGSWQKLVDGRRV